MPTEAKRKVRESEKAYLPEIIAVLNETFGLDPTLKDRLFERLLRQFERWAG